MVGLFFGVLTFLFFQNLAIAQNNVQESSQEKESLDLMIVLAVDVSASISGDANQVGDAHGTPYDPVVSVDEYGGFINEYKLQKQGIIDALKDPEVHEYLQSCNPRGVGLTYMEWSGEYNAVEAKQIVGWEKIISKESLLKFADSLARESRAFSNQTDITLALAYAYDLLLDAPFDSYRKIISISGDGEANIQGSSAIDRKSNLFYLMSQGLPTLREKIILEDITINALAIEDPRSESLHFESVKDYFEKEVIGGPDSFVIPLMDIKDYKKVFKQKLMREMCAYVS